jgi:cyclopropane-fatty-acyl-phospholipid synthase
MMIMIMTMIMIIMGFIIIYKIKQNTSEKFITKLVQDNTDILFSSEKNIINENDKTIIVNNSAMFDKIALNGEIGLAEAYMDGDWDTNNLEEILTELILKQDKLTQQIKNQSINFILMEIKSLLKNKIQSNTIESSSKNISFHYDIGNDLYKKMLDKNMQYTCAYFHKPNMTLDEAQYAKMELVAKKLDLKPNMRILDIGCGFGSFAQHLSNKYDVYVTGVTLSKEQKIYADKYCHHPKVTIELKDYRHVEGKFDRVFSVGCLEHIGRKNYHEYYDKCYELLKNDGIMFIHTIGTNIRGFTLNPFISKYIFPEAELPHIENLSQKFIDKWHLEDMQNIGLSYAKTLRCWHENIGDWSGLDNYDTKFKRMWDFYLLGCAAGFILKDIFVWQLVYTKRNNKRQDDCYHIRN